MGGLQQLHCRHHRSVAGGLLCIHVPQPVLDEQEEKAMRPVNNQPTGLPAPDAEASAHQQAVERHLGQQIQACESGFLPFEQWMDQALYAPGLGYYAAGNTKFGSTLPTGDFTTAPELTPLFAQPLARQEIG